jgi:Tol biopolymer transport system component
LDIESGRIKRLISDFDNCIYASISPDGKSIAYTRGAVVDTIRKGYHGAASWDIYVAPSDGSTAGKQLTTDERNDIWPAWGPDNKTIYFSGEEDGKDASIWKVSTAGGKPVKLVQTPPDAVRFLCSSPATGMLACEADNRIYTTKMTGSTADAVNIVCRTDARGPRADIARYTNNGVSEFALSPDGKRLVVVIRGDLFLVNNEKPLEAKRLTDTPTRERDVKWAPDGKGIVYSSSKDGVQKIYTMDLAAREPKPLTSGPGIDSGAQYSPDGKWIAFLRGQPTSLYLIKPDGADEHVGVAGPKVSDFSWSPDSKWIACVKESDIRVEDIWATPIGDDGKPGAAVNVTDHPGFNESPKWFPSGDKLAFKSNRYRNRDIETINDQGRFAPYTVSLEKDKDKLDEDDWDKPAKPADKKPVDVKIDSDEIERRAKQLVGVEEGIGAIAVSPDSKSVAFVLTALGSSDIYVTSPTGGSMQRLTTSGEAPGDLIWAPDSSKIYFLSGPGLIKSVSRDGSQMGLVQFTAQMQINRLEDYYAVFDEANQVIYDNFYDKTFRGKDWKAIERHYREEIPSITVRTDFDYLMTELLGELNSSHTGYSDPAGAATPARPTGYLGIYDDESYDGPGVKVGKVLARSPASKAESQLKAGDYILAVDGNTVSAGNAMDIALTDKVGKIVSLTVNDKPTRDGARVVKIKPIASAAWSNLRYEEWIDQRRAIVDKVSNGRFGYLHVPDMGDDARNRFERELLSIGERKDGMVLDFRGNNGGDTHDSLLRILARNKVYFTMAPRTETPFPQPEHAYTKPIILVTDEFDLSDAEVFANGFRELGLGKIVGNRTMGWIIFTSGDSLVDGSFIRRPTIGCYTLDGRDMELWGVPPDVLVINTSADFIQGKDAQLEKAVEELLKDPKLKK